MILAITSADWVRSISQPFLESSRISEIRLAAVPVPKLTRLAASPPSAAHVNSTLKISIHEAGST